MELKTCNNCRRIFNSIAESTTCPKCYTLLELKFKEVKQYIRNNPDSSVVVVSEACHVTLEQVRDWIKEERIEYKKDSHIGVECEKCGVMIFTGKYCERCKNEISNEIKKIHNKLEVNELQDKKSKEGKTHLSYLRKDIKKGPFM